MEPQRRAVSTTVTTILTALVVVGFAAAFGYLAYVSSPRSTPVSSVESTNISETSTAATTTTNCSAPNTLCGPYIAFVITSLTSASTLGGNESLLAGLIECTHANLPPASSIEFRWQMPNPVNGGYSVNVNVTTIHIATVEPNWKLNSQSKYDATYAFAIPNSELQVVRGMNYTIGALAYWNSGPLKASDPGDVAVITLTAH
jgi:hypothetical protein